MDIYETIRIRRNVRAYEDKPVPDEVLNRILEAGRYAPSAGNRQPWKFIVVRDSGRRQRLAARARRPNPRFGSQSRK